MNALTLIALCFTAIVAVSCGPHHHHRQQKQHALGKDMGLAIKDQHFSINVEHHRIPDQVRHQLAKHAKTNKKVQHLATPPALSAHLKKAQKGSKASFLRSKAEESGTSGPIPLENWQDWLLVGNLTVGTPAQTISVAFSFWDEDLYLIGAGAVESDGDYYSDPSDSSGSSSSEDTNKNVYNASQSSTSSSNGANFSIDYGTVTGVLVNDIVGLGGVNLNVTFGDLSTYNYWLSSLPVDGFLGLNDAPSDNGVPNMLNQIASQLAAPLVVLNTHRDFQAYEDYTADSTELNEITFGTENVAGCDATSWQWNALGNDSDWGSLNASSVSVDTGTADSPNVTTIAAHHQVYIVNWFELLYVSYQVQDLLVAASGIPYNTTSGGWYNTACTNVTQARNVVIGLADGGSITLTPKDYIAQYEGQCYLYVDGWYDETDDNNNQHPIVLGQLFANNHCVGYDISKVAVGIADKTASVASTSA